MTFGKICASLVLSVFAFSGVALADEPAPPADQAPVDEVLDEVKEPTCLEALKTCKEDKIGEAWKATRTACAALRTCKKDCREGKHDAKAEVRDEFKVCMDGCKGDKACEKACKKDKKAAKKDARAEKRDCNSDCRDEFKTPECKAARKELGKALLSCAQKAGGPCVKALQSVTADE